jgi:glycosyltransferase involved in cell wall biosynthesis
MLDITLITSYFASPIHTNRAPYNEQLFLKLRKSTRVNIIRPISWVEALATKKADLKAIGDHADWNDIPACYPRYYFIPRFGHSLSGIMYYLSIYRAFHKQGRIPDVFYSSWAYPDSYAAMMLAKKHSRPLVMSVLGSDINVLSKRSDMRDKIYEVLSYAGAIFSPSQALKDLVVALGVDRSKVHVVHSGIDAERFYPMDKQSCEAQLSITENIKRVVYIGNFKVAKGTIDFLKGVAKIFSHRQDFEAVLIGRGEDDALVKATIEELNIGKVVRYVGEVDHKNLNTWINASDCLCLPSYAEGLPNVILEALKTQTNVVATNVGGIPEAIKDSENYLFEPGDISALTEKLSSALFDPDYRTEAGFPIGSYDDMADQVLQLIQAVYDNFNDHE